jgi:hypothetical protein
LAVTFCFSSAQNLDFQGINISFQDLTLTKPNSQASVYIPSIISNLSFNIFTIIPSDFQFFLSIFAFTKSQYFASQTFLECIKYHSPQIVSTNPQFPSGLKVKIHSSNLSFCSFSLHLTEIIFTSGFFPLD